MINTAIAWLVTLCTTPHGDNATVRLNRAFMSAPSPGVYETQYDATQLRGQPALSKFSDCPPWSSRPHLSIPVFCFSGTRFHTYSTRPEGAQEPVSRRRRRS